jgi:predicted solute-binding protein
MTRYSAPILPAMLLKSRQPQLASQIKLPSKFTSNVLLAAAIFGPFWAVRPKLGRIESAVLTLNGRVVGPLLLHNSIVSGF